MLSQKELDEAGDKGRRKAIKEAIIIGVTLAAIVITIGLLWSYLSVR